MDDLRDRRHLGRDRKTIRAYLAGREAGVRRQGGDDLFEAFAGYCRQRLADDPHLWASTLFDELLELGFRAVLSDDDPPDPGAWSAPGV